MNTILIILGVIALVFLFLQGSKPNKKANKFKAQRQENTEKVTNNKKHNDDIVQQDDLAEAQEDQEEAQVIMFDEDESSTKETEKVENEFIILYVEPMNDETFLGRKVFFSLEKNNLLLGDNKIFHRYSGDPDQNQIVFSVANRHNPGYLDDLESRNKELFGLALYMTLGEFGDPEQNFKVMLQTAQKIADDLEGKVCDTKHQYLTPDQITVHRRQIKNFKARMMD